MAGFFARLKDGLKKTRDKFTRDVDTLVENTPVIDDDFYEDLTDILILADVGLPATQDVIDRLRHEVEVKKIKDANAAREILKDLLIEEMNIHQIGNSITKRKSGNIAWRKSGPQKTSRCQRS